MKNKYYTPKIEEFHVGFEYELIPSVGYTIFNFGAPDENFETTWATKYSKGIYGVKDVSPFGGALASIRSGIKDKKCRVKYLDRKDIEDLGFIYDEDLPNNYVKKDIDLFYSPDTNFMKIDDADGNSVYFQGVVLNKSEFKKILNQLDIYA